MANFSLSATTVTPPPAPGDLPVSPPSGPHLGSVSIDVQTFPTVVAPAPVFLTAESHSGFASTQGTGNVYQGPHHEIYHYWAVRDTPLTGHSRLQNFLAEWGDANFATGPNVMFMLDEPGSYIIDLWCVDRDGTTAVAATNTITVQDPDVVYAGTKTVCFSNDGGETWAGKPTGARELTNWDDITDAFRTALGHGESRLLFKRGQTLTATERVRIDSFRELAYIGSWGSGALPVINIPRGLNQETAFVWSGTVANDQVTVTDIDWRGTWDSTTETGHWGTQAVSCQLWTGKQVYFATNNCDWSGLSSWNSLINNNLNSTSYMAVANCSATDWGDYGLLQGNGSAAQDKVFGMVGCRFAQHVDALNGRLGKESMANQHGPARIMTADWLYIGACDLFTRNGWSAGIPNVEGVDEPSDQPALRFITKNSLDNEIKTVNIERCVFEGGYHQAKASSFGTGDKVARGNFLMDRILCIGTAKSAGECIYVSHAGMTIRNFVHWVPSNPRRGAIPASPVIELNYQGQRTTGLEGNTVAFYNFTGLNQRTDEVRYEGFEGDSQYVDQVVENFLFAAPGIGVTSNPAISTATSFANITPRYKGVRYGFEWGGISVGQTNNGAQVTIPYSNFRTNLVGENPSGSTNQSYWQNVETQASNQGYTLDHKIKVNGVVYSSREGDFDVAFVSGGVRLTNNTGVNWPNSTGRLVKLDRFPVLPTFKANTASPASVPIPRPVSAPAAGSGRGTPEDFLFVDRQGVKAGGALLSS